jgi:PBSX family phage portal protein
MSTAIRAYAIDGQGNVAKVNSPMLLNARADVAKHQEITKATIDSRGSKKLREEYGTVIGGVKCASRPFDFAIFSYAATCNTYHAAAIDVKAHDVAGRGWQITGESDREKAELTSFFESSFGNKSFEEGMACVLADKEALGNGYLEVIPGLDGKPREFAHIAASEMWIRLDELGFVQQKNGHYANFKAYGADSKLIEQLPANDPLKAEGINEVFHFARYSPWSAFYGIPCILGAWSALTLAQLVAEYNLAFFNNNAIPEYVVLLEGDADENTIRTIQQYFREHLKGQHHKTLVLESPAGAKITFQKVTSDAAKEAAFRMLRIDCRDEIVHAHRIPPQKVGIFETGKLGGNLATEQSREYKDSFVTPNQRNLGSRFNRLIANRFKYSCKFEFKPYDIDQQELQSKLDVAYLNAKVIVPNEVRALRFPELEPLEGGDTVIGAPTLADLAGIDEAITAMQSDVKQAVQSIQEQRS